MSRSVLIRDRITAHLKQVLQLPADTWQLVINQGMTSAAYMDGKNRVHHVDITDLQRQQLKRALGPSCFDPQGSETSYWKRPPVGPSLPVGAPQTSLGAPSSTGCAPMSANPG